MTVSLKLSQAHLLILFVPLAFDIFLLNRRHPCPITADGAKNIADPTSLVPTIQLTELISSVSLLYVLVVQQQSRPAGDNGPIAPFTNEALELVFGVTSLLNAVARLHPYMLQVRIISPSSSLIRLGVQGQALVDLQWLSKTNSFCGMNLTFFWFNHDDSLLQ
jgi:hypothetical protein